MTFDRDAFIDGYIECALWADCMPPEDDPNGETGGRQDLTLRPGARERMARDCQTFMDANAVDLDDYCAQIVRRTDDPPEAYAGHDFWLTRNGHGTGYWDRGLDDLGERLSEAAKAYGEAGNDTPYDCGDGTADTLGS